MSGLVARNLNVWRKRLGHALLRREVTALRGDLTALRGEEDRLTRELAATRASVEAAHERLAAFERERSRSAPIVRDAPHLERAIASLDVADAARVLRQHGCLLLRGDAQTRDVVDTYRTFLDRLGYSRSGTPRGGGLWQVQPSPYYIGALAGSGITSALAPSDTMEFPLHRLVQQRLFELCAAHLGAAPGDPLMSAIGGGLGTIRTLEHGKAGAAPWHQDIDPVGMHRSVTIWVLIDPDDAGVVAPGLRLVLSDADRPAHTQHSSRHEILDLRLSLDQYFWEPRIRVGDLLLFDPYVAHSSLVSEGMTLTRTSVDFRIEPYEPARASRMVKENFGLVLFDRDHMIAPTRLLSSDPAVQQFGYGTVDGAPPSPALDAKFDRARA